MSATISETRLGKTTMSYILQAFKHQGIERRPLAYSITEVIEAKGMPARQVRVVTNPNMKNGQVDLALFELRGQLAVFQAAVKVGFNEVKFMFPEATWIAWNPAWQ